MPFDGLASPFRENSVSSARCARLYCFPECWPDSCRKVDETLILLLDSKHAVYQVHVILSQHVQPCCFEFLSIHNAVTVGVQRIQVAGGIIISFVVLHAHEIIGATLAMVPVAFRPSGLKLFLADQAAAVGVEFGNQVLYGRRIAGRVRHALYKRVEL